MRLDSFQLSSEKLTEMKEAVMANGTLPNSANHASSGLLTPKLTAERIVPVAAGAARGRRADKTSSTPRRTREQSLVRGLLNPKLSSLSLTSLARTAALSGKRLMLEIRDENPVQIVRVSTRGL